MKSKESIIAKVLYSATFLFIVPISLMLWAKYTQDIIQLPIVESDLIGTLMMLVGGIFMIWAMLTLMTKGKGLPINLYPPSYYVTSGPYRLCRHPIYFGFGILLIGYFINVGSASGFWMVSPVTMLGMVALVMGYENIDLKKRFPNQSMQTMFDFPENSTENANLNDRLLSLLWVYALLIISNFLVSTLYNNSVPLFGEPFLLFPVLNNPNLLLLCFIFIAITPFILSSKSVIRGWVISCVLALSISFLLAIIYPSIGAQYLTIGDSTLLSLPIYLIFISLKSIYRQKKMWTVVLMIVSLFLILIQLINSRSAVLHLATSILIYFTAVYYLNIWIFLKSVSEKIANSWKEWVFGNIRVINHGFYVGFGAFFGVLIAGILAGKEYAIALLVFSIIVSITSALWAQIIEGSEKLKRPFGYYGGLVGIIFGSIAVWLMGINIWIVIGVVSVVMPWVQAFGRLRCLINGCCHGRKTLDPTIGIRYYHHRSRVCNISGLKGELLHPTQLYSILWLLLTGLFLITLWLNQCTPPLIFGLYLILTSIGRFVEEAYRGEVQTPIYRKLHLYQWTAILSLIVGIIMTTIQVNVVAINPGISIETVLAAITCGFFIFFAMGVDFPNSNARFSRLV